MKATLLGIAALTGFVLSSCNTTIGLGRDMRILGSEMERKADETYNGPSGADTGYDSGGYDPGGAPVY